MVKHVLGWSPRFLLIYQTSDVVKSIYYTFKLEIFIQSIYHHNITSSDYDNIWKIDYLLALIQKYEVIYSIHLEVNCNFYVYGIQFTNVRKYFHGLVRDPPVHLIYTVSVSILPASISWITFCCTTYFLT